MFSYPFAEGRIADFDTVGFEDESVNVGDCPVLAGGLL
jgi:hypothetical protein